MVINVNLNVRPAVEADRQLLANLIHFETQVHRHLDWRPPLEWINHNPYLVVEQNGRLLAALAAPADPPGVAWIRMFAVAHRWSEEEAWRALWPATREVLAEQAPLVAAAIPLQQWFSDLLDKSDFEFVHDVVLLLWQAHSPRPKPTLTDLIVRPMNTDDLPMVARIDAEAFGLLWRNSLDSLHLAYQQSAVATMAEDETGVVGYQISTAGPMGGHLARLAVLPGNQGKGIGYRLVDDLLNQFERRGVARVTVNTQHDNQASLALYKKMGFRLTGEAYPVYQSRIE